jgi:hypothetical protein
MKFFVAILGIVGFAASALVFDAVFPPESAAKASEVQQTGTPHCEARNLSCRRELMRLREECMADQVSMRELEFCPGFAEFAEGCRAGSWDHAED